LVAEKTLLKESQFCQNTRKNYLFSNRHLLVWYELGSQFFFLNESLSIELQFAHKHLYVVRGTFSQKIF